VNPPALAILGTGTGVGKTVVTAAVGLALRRAGVSVTAWKPVASGGVRRDGRWVSSDAIWLKAALGLREPLSEIGGACWRLGLAPAVAARIERAPLDVEGLGRRWRALRASGRFVLVEGVGGTLVPLRGRMTVADLIGRWGLPALVVGAAGLGTINHTLLTIEALRARGVRIAGVILNRAVRGRDLSERTNARVISTLGRVRVLAALPWVAGVRSDRRALRKLARALPGRAIRRAAAEAR